MFVKEKLQAAGAFMALLALFTVCFGRGLAHIAYAGLYAVALLYLFQTGVRNNLKKFPRGMTLSILVFILVMLLNVFSSVNPAASLKYFVLLLYLMAAAAAIYLFSDQVWFRKYFIPAIAAGTLIGFLGGLYKHYRFGSNGRFTGFMSIMDYGWLCSLFLPFALSLIICFFEKKEYRKALSLLGVFCLASAGLLANNTRIAWFSAFVACLIVFVSSLISLPGKQRRYLLAAGLTLLLLLLSVFSTSPQLRQRFFSSFELNNPQNESNMLRLTFWNYAWGLFLKHPLTGSGLHTMPKISVNQDYQITGVNQGKWMDAHQTYLQFLAETGLIGLIAFLGLFAPSCRLVYMNLRHPNQERRRWATLLLALLAAIASNGLTDYHFNMKIVSYFIASLLAICWSRLQDETV